MHERTPPNKNNSNAQTEKGTHPFQPVTPAGGQELPAWSAIWETVLPYTKLHFVRSLLVMIAMREVVDMLVR